MNLKPFIIIGKRGRARGPRVPPERAAKRRGVSSCGPGSLSPLWKNVGLDSRPGRENCQMPRLQKASGNHSGPNHLGSTRRAKKGTTIRQREKDSLGGFGNIPVVGSRGVFSLETPWRKLMAAFSLEVAAPAR